MLSLTGYPHYVRSLKVGYD
ncbi:hypothetical protein C5167_019606 [Papaver somniferum]|uniref:Uncharacterized protein n=1 Tax=Papaver somniferum TaxID=3469 RepID=A0A4Y7IQM0_PAPSO|nr:hypothetical protein C5167_019606 [Papaver somniferum]